MPLENMFCNKPKYTFSKCYEKLCVFQTFQLNPDPERRGIFRLKIYLLFNTYKICAELYSVSKMDRD